MGESILTSLFDALLRASQRRVISSSTKQWKSSSSLLPYVSLVTVAVVAAVLSGDVYPILILDIAPFNPEISIETISMRNYTVEPLFCGQLLFGVVR